MIGAPGHKRLIIGCLASILLLLTQFSLAQSGNHPAPLLQQGRNAHPYGSPFEFIPNKGQYGDTLSGYGYMGAILWAYEGMGMPFLLTEKGMIQLQRKVTRISHAEEERLEKQGVPEPEIERKRSVIDKVISMEWIAANPHATFIPEDRSTAYHTFRMLSEKVWGYNKLRVKDLYPGIDLLFSFNENKPGGFEYSLLVAPGADISRVQLRFGGDIRSIKTDSKGNLSIHSTIDGMEMSVPVSYYGNHLLKAARNEVPVQFYLTNKTLRFQPASSYDPSHPLVIDPFITGTGNLTGLNNGKAKDVDFDYAGNMYVTGGGAFTGNHSLAKFSAAGTLQWTFNGSLSIPTWTFGTYYGGWMVEKPTGNVYLGQGFSPATGFNVIRISSTGLYDNYITTANPSFMEAWKMFWSCNNGSPQILIAGGGLNSNINFGAFTPPSTTVSGLNITGIPYAGGSGWAQDIADFVFDPITNDMYSIFGSTFGTPAVNNWIFKNTAPYSAASIAWKTASGYTTVQEAANRPYLTAGGLNDNSANMLWVNSSFLFYWDGKNLKAFNKTTGAAAGTALSTANTAFMQGGIIADACNNVFVGEGNGVIKVYQFNGTSFSDAPADINIPGFAGKAVYDLAYDESKKILYASGDGFAASFDVSAYCPNTIYTLNTVPDCATAGVTATVTPAPPAGSTITYTLFNGTVQVATNATGVFNGLTPNITYTIVATINQACNGTQTSTSFVLPGPIVTINSVNTTCGNNTGSITAIGSGTSGPFSYSIDGANFQASGTFVGLGAGIYTITTKDAGGCSTKSQVTILNTNGPVVSVTSTNAECGLINGSLTATASGGTAPYTYSINGTTFQTGNFFTGLAGGNYTLTVKDANGCTNAVAVTISSATAPQLSAIPATATCGNNNGTITAFGTGGTAPLQYSINGNIYQSSNLFNNLNPGTYTVSVKDARGCISTVTVTVGNLAAPTVTAVSTAAACNNVNGTITASGSGGIAPLSYSIDGTNYSTNNIFTGLAAGTYTITVKESTGCTNTVSITVANTNAPAITATSTVSSCSSNTGTITAAATGGTPAYQYSINGTTFQAGTLFSGLAPGTYVVYVRDAGGCIATTYAVVTATAGPSLTASSTPTNCNASTGSITANGSGGTAPLQYSIDGITYQAGNVFSGLNTGNYTVYVKDANGCTRSVAVTVTNISGLTLNVSSLGSNCNNSTGTITATASGGAAPLEYSINGFTWQAGNSFTGVSPGSYTVYVKDANNCIVTKQVVVTSSTGPSLSVTVMLQGTCGNASGVARGNGSGGTAPLTYSMDGGAYQSVSIFINLAPGVHNLTVKDANGCTATQSFNITSNGVGTPPTDVTFTVRDALACTGQLGRIKNIKGEPSGGGNKYIFSLDGGPFTTANQFTNVPPGVHTITAQNEEGCNVTRLVTIGGGVAATATATATPTLCNSSTGTITINGLGPNNPYHASIDGGTTWITFFPPGANSYTFTGLAAGTYAIQIADDADFIEGPPTIPGACITTIYVVVPSTGGPSIATTKTDPTCTSNNGNITAVGSGGTAPYSFSINGGAFQASGVFNNLTAGNYAVSVKDATGCITGTNVMLANTTAPVVTALTEPATCNSRNGSIIATGTGGVAPLEYSLNGTVFQPGNIFSGLAPGSYTLYVKDINNCYSTLSVVIANTALPKVTAYSIPATCNNNDGNLVAIGNFGTPPYTYSLDGALYQSSGTFSFLPAGFYTIYMKDAKGCIVTTGTSISNVTAPSITTVSSLPAACNTATGSLTITASGGVAPLSYSINGSSYFPSAGFTGLLPGNYTVFVKDVNGCIATKPVVVSNTNGPATLTSSIVNAACGLNNGSIIATATGGTAPLQYSLNGTLYQASNTFNGLGAGSYILYVKDAANCIKTIPVTVLNLSGPSVTATTSPSSCSSSDGTITAQSTGGTGAISYSIDGINFQGNNVFTGLPANSYTVTARDSRGCTSTVAVTINTTGTSVIPLFNPVGPICSGALISPLPTTSLNGIAGTWSPALNNTITTIYTFTPLAGQCAATITLTIVVNPKPTPIIIYHN